MMVMNVIDAEGIPDDLIITREQEFSPLPEHIGDHHQNDVILLVVSDLIKHFNKVVASRQEAFRIDGSDLGDRKRMGTEMKFLHVGFDQGLGRHIRGYALGEHSPGNFLAVDPGMACKTLRQHFVVRLAGRALKHDRIGDDRSGHQPGQLFRMCAEQGM